MMRTVTALIAIVIVSVSVAFFVNAPIALIVSNVIASPLTLTVNKNYY